MIIGVGVDIVDVGRFERSLARTPSLAARLFVDSELGRPVASLAARFAAKEALVKAVGEATGLSWHEIVVESDLHRNPSITVSGGSADAIAARGITSLHLSLSHDGGMACAFLVAEGERP
ncbi:holo-ACP synthase [Herbiconiux sp. L3-i23]|uniref:holo-ACP synthase n=1 Tax=Herbiconiux sp. L3-i23 TaxID=2905871 RepID=UPI0020450FE9|nr:holo-ACP synthase [Herbiconiux sp. L3-i23]BDI23837.1 holo-[acyl-carrier-protein] synthase [Herbiconiux sp. L3-i23]